MLPAHRLVRRVGLSHSPTRPMTLAAALERTWRLQSDVASSNDVSASTTAVATSPSSAARPPRRANKGKRSATGITTSTPAQPSRVDALDALLASAPTTLQSWGDARTPSSTGNAVKEMRQSSPGVSPMSTQSTASAAGSAAVVDAVPLAHQRNAQALNEGDTVASGVRYTAQERIDRRRLKLTVAEAEFTVGVTERLFPEVQRLPALHEVHFGDAVVREIGSQVFFAHRKECEQREASGGAEEPVDGAKHPSPAVSVTDLSDEAFAAFEDRAADDDANGSAEPDAPARALPDQRRTASEEKESDGLADAHHDEEEEGIDAVVPHAHGEKPWFVPKNGVVRITPLPPSDLLRLLTLLVYLRHPEEVMAAAAAEGAAASVTSTTASSSLMDSLWRTCWTPHVRDTLLPSPALREKVRCTRAHIDAADRNETTDDANSVTKAANAASSSLLSCADVIAYLDTAPVPVLGFTELLHPREEVSTPAFVFTLYVENVSVQNALGHLATLFAIPQRAFHTRTVASKMSCTSLICAVEQNRLTRELLLLINTMRHPGFVLRVSDVREVDPSTFGERGIQDLFGVIARWQPVYEVEMLLRRVSTHSKDELAHRLRALQSVGAVFFCANREASLARAATDVLHGFYRSAILNALQRRKPPLAMKQFLSTPNVVTAGRARRASTDPTIRHVLRTFVQTGGDWKEAVARAPYVWRRRWINALRCTVWNTMASRRLRRGGRQVMVGDIVVKPEYRSDVHLRQTTTLKAEHVKLVETPEEAAACTLEDVFLPFLRGAYPAHLIAPDSSQHPVLTSANLFRLVQDLHAGPLLTGLSENSRVLLDIRADVAPMLFRRLLLRPLALQFTILEDKAPLKSIHYDAARVLASDRWAAYNLPHTSQDGGDLLESVGTNAQQRDDVSPSSSPSRSVFLSAAATSLVPQSTVLEKTSIGDRLSSGVLAEAFFDIPSPDAYLALGHARRYLDGALFTNTPHTPSTELDDRLYTVHLRAVMQNGSVGLTQLLREYFTLSGIQDEIDSALQHKVHRLRRELDPETPLLTAPSFCTGCYNRDHDVLDTCAEFLFKRSRSSAWLRQRESVMQAAAVPLSAPASTDTAKLSTTAESATSTAQPALSTPGSALVPAAQDPAAALSLCMTWQLHRRNAEEKWGVHMTKSLRLIGIEQVRLIAHGTVGVRLDTSASVSPPLAQEQQEEVHSGPSGAIRALWPEDVVKRQSRASFGTTPREDALCEFLARAIEASSLDPRDLVGTATELPLSVGTALSHAAPSDGRSGTTSPSFAAVLALSANTTAKKTSQVQEPAQQEVGTTREGVPEKEIAPAGASLPTSPTTASPAAGLLRRCEWRLSAVNDVAVHDRREVAAVFLQHDKDRTITLTFASAFPLSRGHAHSGSTAPEANVVEAQRQAHPQTSNTALTPSASTSASDSLFVRVLSDPSVQDALRHTSLASRRWLAHLPETIRMVLTKHRRQYHKNASWGLQIDARDMGLVNFSTLMVQYMFASDSKQRLDLVERAYVSSLSPSQDAFPRNDAAMAAQLFGDVLPQLEPVLNGLYTVTTVNGKRVRSKAEAAAAMAAFQQAVRQSRVLDVKREIDGRVHLPVTLVRKPETLTWLSRIASVEHGGEALVLPPPLARADAAIAAGHSPVALSSLAHDLDGFELAQPEEVATAPLVDVSNPRSISAPAQKKKGGTSLASTTTSATDAAEFWGIQRDPSVLCLLTDGRGGGEGGRSSATAIAAAQSPAPWLSSKQLKAARLTIAVNRRQLSTETQGKWGVRVQRGTLRLLHLQKNELFSFQVYTAKRAQAVRIADTLRYVPPSSSGDATGAVHHEAAERTELDAANTHAPERRRSYTEYMYLVEAVNHVPVHSHEELKRSLQLAASPPNAASGFWSQSSDSGSGGGGGASGRAGHVPESVTLQVRQFPLARVPVVIRRHLTPRAHSRADARRSESGEACSSAAESPSSVGLKINKDMCILRIDADGLCAAGLRDLVSPSCSLMQLVQPSSTGNRVARARLAAEETAWLGLLHPTLTAALTEVVADLTGVVHRSTTSATARTENGGRAAWRYELDEDADADLVRAALSADAVALSTDSTSPLNTPKALVEAVHALTRVVETLLESYRLCSGVDASTLLQVCLINEFCEQCKPHLPTSPPTPEQSVAIADTLRPLWEATEARLKDMCDRHYVQWRVVYAAKSKQTLRTPADLIAAVGPNVKEEVLVIQQCLVLD